MISARRPAAKLARRSVQKVLQVGSPDDFRRDNIAEPHGMYNCLYFLDLTHFIGYGRNPGNNFVAFLENLRHHKFVLKLSDL